MKHPADEKLGCHERRSIVPSIFRFQPDACCQPWAGLFAALDAVGCGSLLPQALAAFGVAVGDSFVQLHLRACGQIVFKRRFAAVGIRVYVVKVDAIG